MSRILQIGMIVLMVIGAILTIMIVVQSDTEDPAMVDITDAVVGRGIVWSYIMLILCVAAAVFSGILGGLRKPKSLITGLGGLVALVVVLGIGYALSSGSAVMDTDGKLMASASASRLSEMGIISFYILFVIAILAVVYSSVIKVFR